MEQLALTLTALGALLALALATITVGRRLPVPRVTLLLLLGILVGPAGLDVLPQAREQWQPVATVIALVMVGFLIGGQLRLSRIRDEGTDVLGIAVIQALVTAAAVAGGLVLLGADVQAALALGGIAAATAPAAVMAVIHEVGGGGTLTRTMVGTIAVSEALSIILFSVLAAVGGLLTGADGAGLLGHALREVVGGVVLGLALGVPTAYLTGRLRAGEATLEEALAVVLLCAGLGIWLEVSYLLAAVVLGAVVANLAAHHERPFHAIEGVEWPFLAVFFILAGASVELGELAGLGVLGAGYVVLRVLGKVAGCWLGARLVHEPERVQRWLGPAMLPQAGVALGLALVLEQQVPRVADTVLPLIVASTVLFELGGPPLTRLALFRVGEVRAER